jgi:cardiolipin synthase A/B
MKLITYGHEAFKAILNDIDLAQNTIFIQMFIWRDDHIGNQMLSHLQNALDRGVKVTIQKDAYGSIFEKAEENKQSLFHKDKQKGIHILAKIIDVGYADKRKPNGYLQLKNPALERFLNHPNLTLSTHILKDHTKFYVIDQKILYVGGVNIEDKEDGKDIQGRTYLDYMVRMEDSIEVSYFLSRFDGKKPFDQNRAIDYVMNRPNDFQVKKDLTHLLNQAQHRILMHMAYFGATSAMQALIQAIKRGVEVTILTSKVSNLQTEYNLYWMNKLQQAGATVYLYEGLVHAKAILADDVFIVGSTNLNNSAYDQLGECSLVVRGDAALNQAFLESHNMILSNTIQTNSIKYSKIKSFFERLLS